MTNLDEAVEQIDNRTVYAVGCASMGYVIFRLAQMYLGHVSEILQPEPKPSASGQVPGQIGTPPPGIVSYSWEKTGQYDPLTGGEIVKKVPHYG